MDLLTFLDESIILCNAAEGQFVHQVDLMGRFHMFVLNPRPELLFDIDWGERKYLKILYDQGKGCAEKHDLSLLGQEGE